MPKTMSLRFSSKRRGTIRNTTEIMCNHTKQNVEGGGGIIMLKNIFLFSYMFNTNKSGRMTA